MKISKGNIQLGNKPKLHFVEAITKKCVMRVGFVSPWSIKLPWHDVKKWMFYEKYKYPFDYTIEARFLWLAGAINIR